MLAEGLASKGISSLRYDKRGVAKSADAAKAEKDLRFFHYIEDAQQWLALLKDKHPSAQLIVIGHSEGALIGAVAAQHTDVAKFVSLAGSGRPIDVVLREQLSNQPSFVQKEASSVLDSLLQGEEVSSVPKYLNSLFRPSVQPYMISWFGFDPQKELAKLDKPILIVQGTTDIQISTKDAQLLRAANANASLVMVEGMNHILKNAPKNRAANIATYSQASLPIVPEIVTTISKFALGKGE